MAFTFNVGVPISAEKMSGALGPIKLLVLYHSHLNLGQPALQAELRAHVIEILLTSPDNYSWEGEIELGGVVHSFGGVVCNDGVDLHVLEGSYDDIDTAFSKIEPGAPGGGYIDWISPWLETGTRAQ